jgi:hypothetical protein
VLDQHPERPTPVADVVLADHPVAEELHHPHQRVADHRRTQVPDVHLLGDVRRRVVDDDRLRVAWPAAPRADRRSATSPSCSARNSGENVTLTKPGAGDLEFARHTVERPGVDDRWAISRGFDPMRFASGSAPLI